MEIETMSKYELCPICGKNIYVSVNCKDFACEDITCTLGHGANILIETIEKIFNRLRT